jgi:hypothetical protein
MPDEDLGDGLHGARDMLTIPEAAAILRISVNSGYELAKRFSRDGRAFRDPECRGRWPLHRAEATATQVDRRPGARHRGSGSMRRTGGSRRRLPGSASSPPASPLRQPVAPLKVGQDQAGEIGLEGRVVLDEEVLETTMRGAIEPDRHQASRIGAARGAISWRLRGCHELPRKISKVRPSANTVPAIVRTAERTVTNVRGESSMTPASADATYNCNTAATERADVPFGGSRFS